MQSLLASLCLQPKHQEASLHFTSQKVKIFHWKEHVGQFLKITLNFPKNSISLMKITGIGQGYMVKTKYPCLSFGTDSTASYTIFVPKKKMMTPKVLREFSFLNHVEVCASTYHGTCIQVKNSPTWRPSGTWKFLKEDKQDRFILFFKITPLRQWWSTSLPRGPMATCIFQIKKSIGTLPLQAAPS